MSTSFERESVSVIGMGVMGSAVARALLAAGHPVTVWNRSAARCEELEAGGAAVAATILEAIMASRLTAGVVNGYDVIRAAVDEAGARADVAGSTIVQYSTGTPGSVQEFAAWADAARVHHLDASIRSYPRTIGTRDSHVTYSGNQELFEAHLPTFAALGGEPVFVGTQITASSVLDQADLALYYGTLMGFFQASAVREAHGLNVADMADHVRETLPVFAQWLQQSVELMVSGDYAGDQSPLISHAAAISEMVRTAEQAKISTALPESVLALVQRAIATGRSHDDIAAIYELIRPPSVDR